MTIENPELYAAGQWDWAILDGCFGDSKIKPTDIDGAVERNGYFLFLEAKAPGVKLKFGQELFFERLTKHKEINALIVWGETNKPEAYQMYNWYGKTRVMPCNRDKLCEIVTKWYDHANKKKPIKLLDSFVLKKRVS